MGEPKRLQFTTLDHSTKPEKTKILPKTLRFTLDLPDSTDTVYPEFCFADLVKKEEGQNGDSEDPFGDDDEGRLAAIAQSFEEKYGNRPKAGKGKKGRRGPYADLVDLGDGYDESDTFIDNSEAYDEILPASLTTKLGGFYINSGRLDFREVSTDSQDEFTDSPSVKKKNKKRRITSDDESGDEGKKVIVKKKKIKDGLGVDGEVKKKKKKRLLVDGEKPFKKPKEPQDKEKLKQQNKTSAVAALLKQQTASTSPKLNGESGENGTESLPDNLSNSAQSSVMSSIDSVVAMGRDDSSGHGDFEDSKKDVDADGIPKLPTGLPENMLKMIEMLIQSAKESQEGKCKFFTNAVNKVLLDVELASRHITCGQRSSVFAHLAAFLPCSKETLLKRAKTLRVKEQDDKIKGPLEKLKAAVNLVMPSLQEKYELEYQKAAQERLEGETKEGQKEGPGGEASTESDEEEKSNTDNKKRNKGPRKKFVWDTNIRQLLCNVVHVKLQTYEMSKIRSQSPVDYLKAFLDAEVKPIWPKGWMQTRMLYKESKDGHSKWTNPQKPKKPILVTKTPVSVASQAVKPSGSLSATVVNSSKITPGGPAGAKVTPGGNNISKVTPGQSSKVTPGGMNSLKTPVGGESSSKISSVLGGNTSALSDSPYNLAATPVIGKKTAPTLLDYADYSSPTLESASVPGNRGLLQPGRGDSSKTQPNKLVSALGKTVPASTPLSKNSWDHVVSDILRSTLGGEQPIKTTSSSATALTAQPKTTGQETYLSQFEKFSASRAQQRSPEAASPVANMSPKHSLLMKSYHTQQQEIQKNKQLQQAELQKKQQEYQRLLKEKQLKSQLKTPPSARSQSAGISPSNPINISSSPGYSSSQSRVSPSGLQPVHKPHNEGSARTLQGQGISMLSENVIRKQLSESETTASSVLGVGSKDDKQRLAHTSGPYNSSSRDILPTNLLRKPSPQSLPVPTSVTVSQVKHSGTTPQVLKIRNTSSASQKLASQANQVSGASPRFPSPTVLSVNSAGVLGQPSPVSVSAASSNGKSSATSLLQSLFGQIQSNIRPNYMSEMDSVKQAMSGLQASTNSSSSSASQGLSLPSARWSPPSLLSSAVSGHSGSRDSLGQQAYRPQSLGPSAARPGYPSVKLSDTSSSVQHSQPGKGLPVPRNPVGSQVSSHLSPGLLHSPHLTSQQLHSLNYGFPYPDGTQ